MTRITSRFVLLIASAAIAPLIVFGAVSFRHLRTGHRAIRPRGEPARGRAGRGADQAVHRSQPARPADRSGWNCEPPIWSPGSSRGILKDYGIDFPELREISAFGAGAASARHQPRDRDTIDRTRCGECRQRWHVTSHRSAWIAMACQPLRWRSAFGLAIRHPAGWSASSRSKSSGAWWTASRSAAKVTRCSSPKTSGWSRTAIRTRNTYIASSGTPGAPRTPRTGIRGEPAGRWRAAPPATSTTTVATRWRLRPVFPGSPGSSSSNSRPRKRSRWR